MAALPDKERYPLKRCWHMMLPATFKQCPIRDRYPLSPLRKIYIALSLSLLGNGRYDDIAPEEISIGIIPQIPILGLSIEERPQDRTAVPLRLISSFPYIRLQYLPQPYLLAEYPENRIAEAPDLIVSA